MIECPPLALAILAFHSFLHFSITSASIQRERSGLTGILLDEVLLVLRVVVRSSLVEQYQHLHAPGVGAVPPSGDLAVRLGEEPVEVLVAVISLAESFDVVRRYGDSRSS